jgi:hypothetical protein
MKTIAYILAAICLESAVALSLENRAIVDPFSPGSYPVNSSLFAQIINPFLDLNLDVFAPNAPGNFPVLYFITGLGG